MLISLSSSYVHLYKFYVAISLKLLDVYIGHIYVVVIPFYPTPSVFFFWKVGHTPSCGQLCALVVYTSNGVYSQGISLYTHRWVYRENTTSAQNAREIIIR